MTQNINLIEELSIQPISVFNSKLLAQIAGAWILLLLLIYSINLSINSYRKDTIAKLEETKKNLTTKIAPYSKGSFLLQETSQADSQNIPVSSNKNLSGFYGYLTDLAEHTPRGVWLTDITFTGSNEITLKGKAISAAGVSAFLNSLDIAKNLDNKNLRTLELKKEPELDVTDFTISSVANKEEKTDKKNEQTIS